MSNEMAELFGAWARLADEEARWCQKIGNVEGPASEKERVERQEDLWRTLHEGEKGPLPEDRPEGGWLSTAAAATSTSPMRLRFRGGELLIWKSSAGLEAKTVDKVSARRWADGIADLAESVSALRREAMEIANAAREYSTATAARGMGMGVRRR